MSGALDLPPAPANSGRNTTLPPVTAHWRRKSRSMIPRSKRRIHILRFADDDDASEKAVGAEAKADSSSSSCFHSVVTADSSLIPSRSEDARKRRREGGWRSQGSVALRGSSYAGEFRRITRLYARQIENRKLAEEKEAECSGNRSSGSAFADVESSRRKSIRGRGTEDGGGEEAAAVECAGSELTVSEMSHVSGGDVRKKARSCVKLVSEAEVPEILKSPDASQNFDGAGQLACSEQLSSGSGGQSSASVYSSCNEVLLSELESELFGGSSEDYFSDLSHLLESSDNFSEKSRDDTRTSVAFSLYLEFTKEFSPSSLPDAPPEHSDEFTLLRFESVEDEESYSLFRIRERRIQLYDYSEEKTITPEYYEMVIHERMVMINWMVEHSNAVELRNETLFLGVSLMDRFLCRGFFKTRRSLHLLGIACVVLATRLEENQPYNNVRRKTYFVGDHAYSRGEVVGMEWLVQEVLNFQCFLPTTYNFLWFYLKAARAEPKVESLAKYLAVLSLLDHDRLRFWPSTVAAGLVVLASLAADSDDSCQWVMETHVRTKNDDLPECIKSLEWLIKHVP